MEYTLANCIDTINQVLNYPSVDYNDISHFFDQAISELNTELNIGLRPISEIYKNTSFNIEDLEYIVLLRESAGTYLTTDEYAMAYYVKDKDTGKITLYYRRTPSEEAVAVPEGKVLYAVCPQGTSTIHDKYLDAYDVFQTVILGEYVYWTPYEMTATPEKVILTNYLTRDWINLYLIPYVCFKYSARNGNSSVLYVEEFTQGFQQLQKSYDIPSFVKLNEQAGKEAYTQDVKENLPNINITIPTRAIYENMKTPRVITAQYGGMYDNGGWGL